MNIALMIALAVYAHSECAYTARIFYRSKML